LVEDRIDGNTIHCPRLLPLQLKDLVKMPVRRVTKLQRAMALVENVPAALPFFAALLRGAPTDG
jgi:hypothetical protein